jgi:hypothetical protein
MCGGLNLGHIGCVFLPFLVRGLQVALACTLMAGTKGSYLCRPKMKMVSG